jgi:3',5'-cyclic AMP phosphodiesterase CpdA
MVHLSLGFEHLFPRSEAPGTPALARLSAPAFSRGEFLAGAAGAAGAVAAFAGASTIGACSPGAFGLLGTDQAFAEEQAGLSQSDEGASLTSESQASDSEQEKSVPITIAVVSDPHFLSPRLTDHGECFERTIRASDAKCMEYSEQIVDALVSQVIGMHPDALVVTGDLTYNGALESHQDFADKLRLVAQAGTPVFVIPGNHDVNCASAARFEGDSYERVASASPEDFADMYADFGYSAAASRDDASLSYAARLDAGDRGCVRFLFIDVNGVDSPGSVPQSTLAWARQQLEEASASQEKVIGFSHQNLLDQSFVANGYTIDNADELLALYEEYGVRFNMSGHLHCQHYEQTDSGLTDAALSALCVTPVQFAVVRLSGLGDPNSLADDQGDSSAPAVEYATTSLDMRSWALAQTDPAVSSNPDLLDFDAYARDFFSHTAYDQLYQKAVDNGYAEDEADAIASYATDAICLWFAGRLDTFERNMNYENEISEISLMTGYFFTYSFDKNHPKNENTIHVNL